MNIHRILVTGGSGFVGSHIIRHMVEKYPDVHVVNLDNLSTGSLANVANFKGNSRYHFVHADIRSRATLEAVLGEEVDVVINAASVSSSPLGGEMNYIETNVLGLSTLLSAISHQNRSGMYKISRIIQLSVADVRGHGENVDPQTRYGASQAAAEMECAGWISQDGLPILTVRSCELFGQGQHATHGLAALFAHKQQWHELAYPYKTYEWLSVEDFANAVDFVLFRGKVGQTYEAGSGDYVSIDALQKAIHKGTVPSISSNQGDYPTVDASALSDLGWKPKDAIDEYLQAGVR